MTTKLGVFCDKVLEAGWLMAVILVPLFFNVYSSRVFEPDKLTLLRSVALVMVVAWLIKLLESRGATPNVDRPSLGRRLVETPLILPILALAVVYLISTLGSVVPLVSLLGSYQRLQGTFTTFSYLIVFAMMLHGLRRREQVDRFVYAVMVTSLSVSLYGLIQHDRLDPLPWGGDVTSRVASNMGNAIFVAAYLIMTLPIALSRMIDTLTQVLAKEPPESAAVVSVMCLIVVLAQIAVWMAGGFVIGIIVGLALILAAAAGAALMGRPVAPFVLLASYSFMFAAQIVAIIFSQSRGPWLGLMAGLYVFVLLGLVALRRLATDHSPLRRDEIGRAIGFGIVSPFVGVAPAYAVMASLRKGLRWLWLSWVVQGVVAILLLVLIAVPGSPLSVLAQIPYLGRLSGLAETSVGSNVVRVLIWQGAAELVPPHAPLEYPSAPPSPEAGPVVRSDSLNFLRPIIGYGPESMYVAYNRYYQPELAHHEARNASPDRAHNETWDSLIITGALGFLVYLALFGAVFYCGLRWVGLGGRRRDRTLFIALWAGGALLGALAAILLDNGQLRFVGLGIPFGALIGLLTFVMIDSALSFDPDVRPFSLPGMPTLLIGVIAAILAHFVEIQVGIAIASTRTHFWVYAAVLVAIGFFMARRPVDEPAAVQVVPEPARTVSEPPRARGPQPKRGKSQFARAHAVAERPSPQALRVRSEAGRGSAPMAVKGLIIGVITMTMVFCFWTRSFNIAAGNFSILWLFIGTWLLATVVGVVSLWDPSNGSEVGDWVTGLIVYVVASLGVLIVFALVYSPFLHAPVNLQGVPAVLQIASQINWLLKSFYLVGFVVMLLLAFALYRSAFGTQGGQAAWQDRNWWLYPILIVAVLWTAFMLNVRPIMADMVYKQALPYDDRQDYDLSLALYNQTIALAPGQDFYYLFLGRAHLEKAQRTADPNERDQHLAQSRDALTKALELNPLNTDHSANLSRLYRAWGGIITTPADRIKLLEQSAAYYAQAASLSPNTVQIRNERGLVLYFLGRYQEAVDTFQYSLKLDSAFVDTYVFLGDSFQALNKPEEALAAHLKAIELSPGSLTEQRLFSLPVAGFQERRIDFYVKAGLVDRLVQAIEANPNWTKDFGASNLLGNIYLKQGAQEKALGPLTLAAELNPNDLGVRLAVGYIYAQTNRLEQALAEFQKAVQIAPNDLVANRNLGSVLRQLNRLDEAQAAFEKGLAASPNDALTIQNLADLHRVAGRTEEALKFMKRWVELAPDDFNANKNLSIMYRDTSQITEAISYGQKALQLAPEDQRAGLQDYVADLEKRKAGS